MAMTNQARPTPFRFLSAILAVVILCNAARGDDALQSGVSMIPKDAAFVSATLRLEEQWKLLSGSRAWASLRTLPPVQLALAQLEEQKLQPGSPLSMLDTYMQLPENQQAVEVLGDMVSTDTFLYGEPSCITFLQLVQKVQQAQNAANILGMARGVDGAPLRIESHDHDSDDAEEMDDEGVALPRGASIVPVRRQVAEIEEFEMTAAPSSELAARMVLQALADNADKIVVPDLVWGFKTGKVDAAAAQLKRIEVLLKLVTQAQPGLAEIQRRTIGDVDAVVLTVDGSIVPWAGIFAGQDGVDDDDMEKVYRAFRGLDLVIAIGTVGDRVILSIGDSADHLEKLVSRAGGSEGLVGTKPFEPLREHKGERITSIGYVSEALARAAAPSAADLEQLAEMADTLADAADLPEGAAREARELLRRMADGYQRRLPVPGPMMSYSFLSGAGYEGYVWDWSKGGVLDGSKRLDLLANTGATPLASLVFRAKSQPEQFDDFVSWGGMGWSFARKYLLPKADQKVRELVVSTEGLAAPLVERLVTTLRTKFLPALADGQMGFVIDAKARAKRLQAAMPEASEPLPLVEPAIAFRLSDAKLFREGLSDLFELADDVVAASRTLDPDSMPEGARLPEPERSKVDGGSLWTFSLEGSGIDTQIRPSIAISDETAVFSLAPAQADRMLREAPQQTGAPLSAFETPLAGAAALDVAGFVDVLEPWILYAARVGVRQQRDGTVDADAVIGPEDDDGQVKEMLSAAGVVLDALRCLRVAVAETSTRPDATVTRWRNTIRDLPAR